jgi:hypothetical protein
VKHDTYDILQAAKADAPPMRHSVDDFVAGGRRLQGRRRAAWATGAAAAAVVAVAAAVVLPQVAAQPNGASVPAAASLPAAPLRPFVQPEAWVDSSLTGYTVGEFRVTDPVLVTPGYQQASIFKGDAHQKVELADGTVKTYPWGAALTVYRKGVYDPARFSSATPVTVNGRHGLFADDVPYVNVVEPKDPKRAAQLPDKEPSLAWQYADDSWAVISSQTDVSSQEMIKIASGLTSGAPKPAKLAFKASYLPAGYTLTSAGIAPEYAFGGPPQSFARFVKGQQPYTRLTEPVAGDRSTARSITFSLIPTWFSKYSAPKSGPATAPFCKERNLCYRATDDGKHQIQVTGSGDESDAELIRILKGLTFADFDDTSSWFDVTAAAPAIAK